MIDPTQCVVQMDRRTDHRPADAVMTHSSMEQFSVDRRNLFAGIKNSIARFWLHIQLGILSH